MCRSCQTLGRSCSFRLPVSSVVQNPGLPRARCQVPLGLHLAPFLQSVSECTRPSGFRPALSSLNSHTITLARQPVVVANSPCLGTLRQGSEVRGLLALRAAVLRRAVRHLGPPLALLRVRSSVLAQEVRAHVPGIQQVLKAGQSMRVPNQRPNPSIEGTSTIRLRLLAAAPHVKR